MLKKNGWSSYELVTRIIHKAIESHVIMEQDLLSWSRAGRNKDHPDYQLASVYSELLSNSYPTVAKAGQHGKTGPELAKSIEFWTKVMEILKEDLDRAEQMGMQDVVSDIQYRMRLVEKVLDVLDKRIS